LASFTSASEERTSRMSLPRVPDLINRVRVRVRARVRIRG